LGRLDNRAESLAMDHLIDTGRYTARLARNASDVRAAQRLRFQCFFDRAGLDRDGFDAAFDHILIEAADGALVACCRFKVFAAADLDAHSYAGRYYDLTSLAQTGGTILEIGRFCVLPNLRDADVLRVAWGALARFVDQHDASLLIGCTSFVGCDPAPFADGFAHLAAHHIGSDALRPKRRAAEVIKLAAAGYEPRAALKQLPPLLRTYLTMGGWVSDHAVIDRDMETLHVFTAVPVSAVPMARARALRKVAQHA